MEEKSVTTTSLLLVDNKLMSMLFLDSMLPGNTKNTPSMLLLTTPNGKDLYTNTLNITTTSVLETLTSVFLLSPSKEKSNLITSSFPTKFGKDIKLTENYTPTVN